MSDYKYRPDVDGLRALAVTLVVVYHAGLGFSGGFVGVDVFFVISGFLITGLILKQQDQGTFQLSTFWLRRIRRIIPASTVMVATCLLAGIVLLLPSDFNDLAKSAIAQQLMLANVFFFRNTGYFGGNADLKPLLHMWSLSVEEQFYLGYPFILVAMRRAPRKWLLGVLLGLAAASFACSQGFVGIEPSATFYLLPTRAWEMILGGLVCFLPRIPQRWLAELSSLLGLFAIVASAWIYDSATRFPGAAALAPCLGAALIIFSGTMTTTIVGQLLSLRSVVFVGLLSYSLYLWHWPLLAFTRYWVSEHLPPTVGVTAVFASCIMAYLSWRYIETPVREGRIFGTPRMSIAVAAISLCMMLVGSGAIMATKGFKFRFSERVLAFDQKGLGKVNPEFEGTVSQALNGRLPRIGDQKSSEKIDVIIWGDSHARVVGPICDELAEEYSLSGVLAAKSGTHPIFDSTSLPAPPAWNRKIYDLVCGPSGAADGAEWNRAVFDFIASHKIPNVLLVGHWESAFRIRSKSDEQTVLGHTQSFQSTVQSLNRIGAKVWVLEQVPEQPFDPNRQLCKAAFLQQETPKGIELENYLKNQLRPRSLFESLTGQNLIPIEVTRTCFDESGFSLIGDERGSYYWDDDHLSKYGAEKLLKGVLRSVFSEIANRLNQTSSLIDRLEISNEPTRN